MMRGVGEVTGLTEAMGGRGLFDDVEIRPTSGERFLATDGEGDWGAALRFSVAEDGEAYCDCVKAQRGADGRWADIGSGGSRFGGWDVPWRPPDGGWDDGPMLVMTTVGQTVFDPRDEAFE